MHWYKLSTRKNRANERRLYLDRRLEESKNKRFEADLLGLVDGKTYDGKIFWARKSDFRHSRTQGICASQGVNL